MPGDSNQPDPKVPHDVSSSTAGEFTQIFASKTSPQSVTADGERSSSASAEDDFAKLFLTSAESGGPTSNAPQKAASSDATLIFEALPGAGSAPNPVPAQRAPVTQPQPAASVTPAAPRGVDPSPSDFTQVFSQIPLPSGQMPESKAPAKPLAAPAGEFTRFFSAIAARENLATPAPPSGNLRSPSAASHRPGAAAEPADDFDRMFRQAPASSAQPTSQAFVQQITASQEPVSPGRYPAAADDSTQIFQHSPPASFEPSRSASVVPSAPSTGVASDSFTQVFQQIAPPQVRDEALAPPLAPAMPTTPKPPLPLPAPAIATQEWPAFGPPPSPSGSFTDVFAAQPSQPPPATAWPGRPASNTPESQGGGFTELFQARPNASPSQPAASPFANPGGPGGSVAGWPAVPSSPAPHEVPPASGGGDFTWLMQSLTPSAQSSSPAPPRDDAFFAPYSLSGGGAYQESEFTRVQQASSRREAGVAPASLAAAAAVAPGLALAPSTEKAAEKDGRAKKSKKLIILLVVMNLLLLLALIVIAVLVMRHK